MLFYIARTELVFTQQSAEDSILTMSGSYEWNSQMDGIDDDVDTNGAECRPQGGDDDL